jgi:crotonobetainyl-CoA:carnitine CoA-transferase CaiB-like acyl-CoA transferase
VAIKDAGVESVDSPIRFNGISRSVVTGPPRSGQQTREILAELGYDEGRVETQLEP